MTTDAEPPVEPTRRAPRRRPRRRLPRGLFLVCALLALAAASLILVRALGPKPPEPLPPVALPEGNATDLYGDPLPPYAVARFGSVRFRAGSGAEVAVSRDGTRIAAGSLHGRIVVLDAATGRRTHLFAGHLARIPNPDYEFDPEDWFKGRDRTQILDELRTLVFVDDDRAVLSFGATLRRNELASGETTLVAGPWRYSESHSHALSADGDRAASVVSGGYLLRRVDASTGSVELHPIPQGRGARFLRFSPDGRRIAFSGTPTVGRTRRGNVPNSAAFVLDADTGEILQNAGTQHGSVFGLAYDGDDTVWVAGQYGQLAAWSLARDEMLWGDVLSAAPTKAERARLRGGVPSIALSPDGATLAVLGHATEPPNRAELDWLDARTGAELRTSAFSSFGVHTPVFSPDGETVVVRRWSGVLEALDVATGASRLPEIGHRDSVAEVVVAPDGRTAASLTGFGDLRIWDLATGEERARTDLVQFPWGIAFDPTGRSIRVFAGGRGPTVPTLVVLSATDGRIESRTRIEPPDGTKSARVVPAPDGERVLVVGSTGPRAAATLEIRTFDGTVIATRTSVDAAQQFSAWTADSSALISSDLRVAYDATDPARSTRLRWTLTGNRRFGGSSPDGRLLIGLGNSGGGWRPSWGHLEVFDREHRRVIGRLERRAVANRHHDVFRCVSVSPDGQWAAVGTCDGEWLLLELPSARVVTALRGHLGAVTCIAFTPQGDRFVTGSDDGTLLVWDLNQMSDDG